MPNKYKPTASVGLQDGVAFRFAFGLEQPEADALASTLRQLRDSPKGLSAQGVRLLRAIEARRASWYVSSKLNPRARRAETRVG